MAGREPARQRGATAEPAKSYQVPALDKALDVLEALADLPEGAAMTELTRMLGRSMGEIYRTVIALERRGFVAKDEATDRYYLSLRLFELAHRHPPVSRLVRLAQPILDGLALSTKQSCHLGVAEGDRLLILASAMSPLPMSYAVKVGATFPLLETSSGVVILAFMPPDWRAARLAGLDPDEVPDIEARAEAVRGCGQEVYQSRVVIGVTNLTVPVRDHRGSVIAALTIPYLKQLKAEMTSEEAIARAAEAAETLSRGLGYGLTQTPERKDATS